MTRNRITDRITDRITTADILMARSMPKETELTWQPGSGNRNGRWKKIYRGKTYSFSGGRGKSDRDAYDAAVKVWQQQKLEADAHGPKPHQADYERVIREWESVRNWCREHGDPKMEEVAEHKLDDLRKRLSMTRPTKIVLADTLDGQFDMEALHPGWRKHMAAIGDAVMERAGQAPISVSPEWQEWQSKGDQLIQDLLAEVDPSKLELIDPASIPKMEVDSLSVDRVVWHDRLETMERKADPKSESVGVLLDNFIKQKQADATAGEVSLQHVFGLMNNLTHFKNWLGESSSVHKITSATLVEYRALLLKEMTERGWSATTASHRMTTIKSFIRWLWQTEVIESFPRVLQGTGLHIRRGTPKVTTYTIDEIHTLLKAASQRTRLFILLMLNCGMTQKDIADLLHSEVDWKVGRITRKRSKTKKHANVPIVSYPLWPETAELLRLERTTEDTDRVLLNVHGHPLLVDGLTSEGKPIKCDNVRNSFDRLCKKTGIQKTLKSLKKTSATLLRGSRHYSSLENLFLGHAPTTMADKFYTLPPQDLFDEAVTWLRGQLRIGQTLGVGTEQVVTTSSDFQDT